MIDINNEEQILKECDFNYFYNSKECSRELCMFFNDIAQNEDFDKRQAYIDLGRIGITLNQQDQKIKDLEYRLSNCIEPKFKIGQEVWVVDSLSEKIYFGEVDFIEAQKFKGENVIWYQVEYFDECTISGPFEEPFTFATETEAKAKLEELKNG